MKITRQELTSNGKKEFFEELHFTKDDYKDNQLLIDIKSLNFKIESNCISDLIMMKFFLKGDLILKSTRSLKPVDYKLNVKDEIIYTLNKDLVDEESVFYLENDEIITEPIAYSLLISSLPLQVIAKDEEDIIEGDDWEVITEDEYNKRKNDSSSSPFACLKDIDLE